MFGIIVASFATAIGGAIVFGLLSILPSEWQRFRSQISVLAALCIGVLVFLADPQLPTRPPTSPTIERLVMASELRGAASALRRDDPAAFRRALSAGRLLAAQGEDQAAVSRVRIALFAEAKLRRREMSDRFHTDRLNLVRDELLELASTSPGLCWAIVRGRAEDVTMFPISAELRRREFQLLQRAFEAGGAPAQPLDHDTFQGILDEVFAELQTTFGDDAFLVQESPSAALEQRYCEVAAEYTRLLSLTPEPGRLFATAENMMRGPE